MTGVDTLLVAAFAVFFIGKLVQMSDERLSGFYALAIFFSWGLFLAWLVGRIILRVTAG